jgi:hypothetical protein
MAAAVGLLAPGAQASSLITPTAATLHEVIGAGGRIRLLPVIGL